ncbi:MAG TPA: aspartate/glutamate racemase family protein [Burkholderiales bacterium]|nr:aspartate/glutamate racemase family protein [Burkholderiales bacterium]
MQPIRIIDIPPYQRAGVNYDPAEGHFMMTALIADLKANGQLEGVEITVDPGEPTDHGEESRDDVVFGIIAVGIVKRIKAACESGKYDAIVTQAGIEPGFLAAKTISTLPIAYPVHSALHFASAIGEKCCVLTTTDAQSQTVRRNAQLYGLSHKVTSVRYVSRSSTYTMALVRKYPKAERMNAPEVREFVDSVVNQFVRAIEDEGVDTVIIGSPHQQCFLDEVRLGLNEKGYGEIQLLGAFACAVEMARAMVNLKAPQTPRAFPNDKLKAKPAFR